MRRIAYPHDAQYTQHYFENDVEEAAVHAAMPMSESIVSEFGPERVVDVGCGTGALLAALKAKGCEVVGLEYSQAAIQFCRKRGIDPVRFDLESQQRVELGSFDVAISLEVAEHLPQRTADRYADLMSSFAPIIVFTAATPGQGGMDHVNEQPHSYWIDKFKARGFAHDKKISRRFGEVWTQAGVECWYVNNLMIFRAPRD